ncbi:MAG: hypothetical protein CSA68_10030 [Rhodobacterales bacterium]|nr:MAG: hypothetical protein CSA68_10030 [Rhodobacterales bacterium]
MFRIAIISLLMLGALPAAGRACVAFDGARNRFSNACDAAQYVQYRTVGGGCYLKQPGHMSLQPGESATDPKLGQSCGSDAKWWVQYGWCDLAEWQKGACKVKP